MRLLRGRKEWLHLVMMIVQYTHTHIHEHTRTQHTHTNTCAHAHKEAEITSDVEDLIKACRGHCSSFSSATLSFTSPVSQHLLTFSVFLLFCNSIIPHFIPLSFSAYL